MTCQGKNMLHRSKLHSEFHQEGNSSVSAINFMYASCTYELFLVLKLMVIEYHSQPNAFQV
jgi:hypothetical protein